MEHLVFISHSSEDAPIAQLICHRLEDAGIRCWIAPRDIRHGDWAGSIMDGFARADVCVVVVGEHSVGSPEVLKEVTEATRSCEYIIPFKLDAADLSPRLRYHLGPCHWLDASIPPLEKRIEDLKQRIFHLSEEDVVYMNRRQMSLVEKIVWPRPLFLGRREELAEIAARLPEERVLILQGMGGIGKSAIAKVYAREHRDDYDTVIFLGYEGSILDLVCGEGIVIENLPPQDPETESAEQFFRRKMEAFRRLASERVLLILDNFDVDSDPHFADLANAPCRLLVTTRNERDDYGCLKIGPIADFDALRELFCTAYGKPLKEDDMAVVDQMIRLVGCHTLTVDLIARQMKESRRKPAQMLELLREKGLNTRLKERIRRSGEAEADSAFGYIARLFELSDLSRECEEIMRYMAMVPYTGMDIDLFADICQLDSYNELNELIAHSWLLLDEDTDVLSMHPVVADVVRETLKPDVENGKTYIAGLWREVGSLWNRTLEERAALWPYYAYIIAHFFDPVPELFDEFAFLANNAWICGRYQLAIETGRRFLDYVRGAMPEDHAKIGLAACYLGGCYHNAGDDAGAAPYYEEGLREQRLAVSDDSPSRDWEDLATSCQKVGRCAALAGDFEKAAAYLEESVRIMEEHCPGRANIGNSYLEMGRAYIAAGDYETAIGYAEKAQKVYVASRGRRNPNSACALTDLGRCLTHLGRPEEARRALDESLELNLEFNGPYNLQTFQAKDALADLALAVGDSGRALGIWQETEAEMEQCFGAESPHLKAVRDKIIQCQRR